MTDLLEWIKLIPTEYGFKWGFVEVQRTTSNDGIDKRKRFNAVTLTHINGDRLTIVATKEGFEVDEIKK